MATREGRELAPADDSEQLARLTKAEARVGQLVKRQVASVLVTAENRAAEIRRQASEDAESQLKHVEGAAAGLLDRVDTLAESGEVNALRRELDALRESAITLDGPTSVLPPLEREPSAPEVVEVDPEDPDPDPDLGEREPAAPKPAASPARPGIVKRFLGRSREQAERREGAAPVEHGPYDESAQSNGGGSSDAWRDATGAEMECMICRRPFSDNDARLARCCRPEPGDAIVGYLAPDGMIAVHRHDCPRVQSLPENRWE